MTPGQALDVIRHLRQLRPTDPRILRRVDEQIDALWMALGHLPGEANWNIAPFAPWMPGQKGNVSNEH